MEEVDQRLGHDRTDALDRRQFGFAALGQRCAAQLLNRAEAFEQIARGDDADVADTEAEQETRAVGPALGLDRGEEVVDRLLFPALAAEQIGTMLVQAEDVGWRMQPAELDELRDALFAQPLDVERTARDEMPQPFEPLRRTDQAA